MMIINDFIKFIIENSHHLGGYHLILDDGHGWDTKGKRSPDGDNDGRADMKENLFNEAMVRKLGLLCDMFGLSYDLIAGEWWDVPLRLRMERENRIYMKCIDERKHCIFLSVHANGYGEDWNEVSGVEGFYWHSNKDGEKLVDDVLGYVSSALNQRNRGSKGCGANGVPSFYVVKNSRSLGILMEYGFMTNKGDLLDLMNDRSINLSAVGTMMGIVKWIKDKEDSRVEFEWDVERRKKGLMERLGGALDRWIDWLDKFKSGGYGD